MRYARNIEGKKNEVSYSGEKGTCLDCSQEVRGHKGQYKQSYWQHTNKKNCDSWHEPITKWHIDWQNEFDEKFQEITLFDENKNEFHRADVRTNSGLVIEIQNSPIKSEEIQQRESFYGQYNLIWILNGANLLKQCNLKSNYERKDISITFEVPHYIEEIDGFDFDKFNEYFYESQLFLELKRYESYLSYDNKNGNYHIFQFKNNNDFQAVEYSLKIFVTKILEQFSHNTNTFEIAKKFSIQQNYTPNECYINVRLEKKYWRKFIDLMKYPVFIDNLNGVKSDWIYFYQKNKLIKKNDFILNIEKNWL